MGLTVVPMKLNISGFTDPGTQRNLNQDRILINGKVLSEGLMDLAEQGSCVCFVADGVGGNHAGEFASNFVLESIRCMDDFEDIDHALRKVNTELVTVSSPRRELAGTSTTLTGVIVTNDHFRIVHVGDSQVWLRRNGTFFKVTNDHVVTEYEANSPLTSYFGGSDDDLKFDDNIFVRDMAVGDVFLICSDGLFKALNHKNISAILGTENELPTQARALLRESLQSGAEDNVSAMLIQRTQ